MAHNVISFGDENRGFQIGVQNGPIHLPPDRPETPPKPSSTIPFRRDPDFVNRQTLIDELHKKCSTPAARIALVGLGGIGKSQLAIEYSYQIRFQSPETWVFWVHASSAARFEQSYREIADYVKIPHRREPKADVFKLVYNWLQDERNGKCLLILDNVDDTSWLFETRTTSQAAGAATSSLISGSTQPLSAYIPQSPNSSILITSRTRSVAPKLVEESDIIAVEPMDEAHAVALFEKKLGLQGDRKDILELAAALDYMPLAIVQAAAFITQKAPRCSVRQYIEKFQKTDKAKMKLLNHEAGHLRRDWDAKSSIFVTWQISFDHIQQVRPSAADLLSLMCFFDRQGIPETLVLNRGERNQDHERADRDNEGPVEEDTHSESSVNDEFEDDISTLRNYSFIFVNVNINGTTFTMHRLVQLATREWLKSHSKLERWKQQYIKNLRTEFPTSCHNWVSCEALFPHAKSALAQQPEGEASLRDWAVLLYNAAWYALEAGNFTDAEKMSVASLDVWINQLGLEHGNTLNAMAIVAMSYSKGGLWNKAEVLEVQVMETEKRVLGHDHPSTLSSMANLASTYWNQGRWKEAEDLEMQVLEARKGVSGQEHPGTLTSMTNLASIYRSQGRWKEAEDLEVQVMETEKRVLGQEHPDTLACMGNLASTYWSQGRWKEAEDLHVQVIEARKRVSGQEHPDTLTCMGNLALTYLYQGRLREAEDLHVQVLETRKMLSGHDHPSTLACMGNLASTYSSQDRWKEAEDLHVQVLEARKRVLGQEHPGTLVTMSNLASTYWSQGRWKEAENLEVQVLEARKRTLGGEHPDTLQNMNNLAWTWKHQGRDAEAIQLMTECLQTSVEKLGVNHPDTLSRTKTYNGWVEE